MDGLYLKLAAIVIRFESDLQLLFVEHIVDLLLVALAKRKVLQLDRQIRRSLGMFVNILVDVFG